MMKGKLKHIILGLGVLIVSLAIMKSTSFAFGNINNEGFRREERGHHGMMWDYNGEEFRGHRGHRGPGACMGYYNEDYEYDK